MDELENLSQKYYLGCYKSIHYKGLLGAFTRKYHYKLEKGRTKEFSSTLEIGAGSGEHLRYVNHKFEKYDTKTFATRTGLEPATSAVTGRRANQLRYRALSN